MARSRLALGAILIVIAAGAIYLGTKSESTPAPTPTATSPSPTITPTTTSTVPMNDTDAVNQLLSSYHDSVRTKSLDNLMSLFTDDAVLITANQMRFSGKTQISGYFSYVFNQFGGEIKMQIMDSSVTLEVSKATARVRIMTEKEIGSEFFELIKVRSMWKISSLTLFEF